MTGEVIVGDINPEKLNKAVQWDQRIKIALSKKCCVICGAKAGFLYQLTCSEKCHDQMKGEFIETFGPYKNITDIETGKTHRVPTGVIFEGGIRQQDLKNYPVV